ncbi:MAG TPA: beta-ketoacyl synthase N-terminal-like domain-containing protein, partial [Blastocatellia bacterium]
MRNVFIAAPVRTPIGKFGGTLKDWSAADLCVPVVEESLKRAGVLPDMVDEVIIGNARQAGGGPNVARQISYRAGIPDNVPAYTVNKACGSGLKAIVLAAQEIMLGRAELIVAGGSESMSRVPYLADGARWGYRMGNFELVDGMYRDGFLDPLSGQVMGETAETLARQYE